MTTRDAIIRKDGWASKALCNAIGTGINPQTMHPTLAVGEKLQARANGLT